MSNKAQVSPIFRFHFFAWRKPAIKINDIPNGNLFLLIEQLHEFQVSSAGYD
jgi:hypothetical protein